MVVVGAVGFLALYPAIGSLAGYVGIAPGDLAGRIGGMTGGGSAAGTKRSCA